VGPDGRIDVATVDECRAALIRLATSLANNSHTVRRKVDVDRRLVCHLTDLKTSFRARLYDGRLTDIAEGDDPHAKITLTASSDDLVAIVNGELDVTSAMAARRISIRANPLDLLRLRKLL
jgi:putative sterol carrier protein